METCGSANRVTMKSGARRNCLAPSIITNLPLAWCLPPTSLLPTYPQILLPLLDVTPQTELLSSHVPTQLPCQTLCPPEKGLFCGTDSIWGPSSPPCLMVLGASNKVLALRGCIHLFVHHSPRSAQQQLQWCRCPRWCRGSGIQGSRRSRRWCWCKTRSAEEGT